VSVAFLAFVVELYRKVRQIWNERSAKRSSGAEFNSLLVLGPLLFGVVDSFLLVFCDQTARLWIKR
jgi:hypothetical protein